MSYLVLARKWRPLAFDDVVGQDHITQTLRKAVEKDRLAHALLFAGTRGVGKTTTARILARALNCDKGPTPNPCGVCEACTGIIAGSSLDVMEIDGASNRGIDNIRELRETVTYSTITGRSRVVIIDEVHMLTREAFNALLKTLEEPPPQVVFVLATTEANKIPATILSRCQRYDFRRITAEQIAAQLEKICTSEKIVFEQQALVLVARKADGSMRDALSLLDQVFSYGQDRVDEAHVRMVLGVVDAEVYRTLMDAVRGRDPAPVLDVVDKVLLHGYDLADFVNGLQEYIRNLLFARVPGLLQSRGHEMTRDAAEAFAKQSEGFTEGTLLRMAELVRRTETDLRWSSYPRFLIESMLLRLMHMDETVSLEQLLKSVSAGLPAVPAAPGAPAASAAAPSWPLRQPAADEKKKPADPVPLTPSPPLTFSAPAPTTPATQPRPAAASAAPSTVSEPPPAPVADDAAGDSYLSYEESEDGPGDDSFTAESNRTMSRDLRRDWPAFIRLLTDERPNLGAFLAQAKLVSSSGQTVELRYPHQFRFQYGEVTKRANRDLIVKKLSDFAGATVDMHITVETPPPAGPAAPPAQSGPVIRSIEDEMRTDPMIGKVLEFFDGEVLL